MLENNNSRHVTRRAAREGAIYCICVLHHRYDRLYDGQLYYIDGTFIDNTALHGCMHIKSDIDALPGAGCKKIKSELISV